jgi:hypothetical protein
MDEYQCHELVRTEKTVDKAAKRRYARLAVGSVLVATVAVLSGSPFKGSLFATDEQAPPEGQATVDVSLFVYPGEPLDDALWLASMRSPQLLSEASVDPLADEGLAGDEPSFLGSASNDRGANDGSAGAMTTGGGSPAGANSGSSANADSAPVRSAGSTATIGGPYAGISAGIASPGNAQATGGANAGIGPTPGGAPGASPGAIRRASSPRSSATPSAGPASAAASPQSSTAPSVGSAATSPPSSTAPSVGSAGTSPPSSTTPSAGPASTSAPPRLETPPDHVASAGPTNLVPRLDEASHPTASSHPASADQGAQNSSSSHLPTTNGAGSTGSPPAPNTSSSTPTNESARNAAGTTPAGSPENLDENILAMSQLLNPAGLLLPEAEQQTVDAAAQTLIASSGGSATLFDTPPSLPSTAQLDAADPNQVPEPATLALLGFGLVAVAFARRRQQRNSRAPAASSVVRPLSFQDTHRRSRERSGR